MRRKTSIQIDESLRDEVQIECIRRKTDQTRAIEEALRLWLSEGKGFAPTMEGAISGEKAEYPAHLKPVIDELLHTLYDEPEGPSHEYVQRILREGMRLLRREKG